MDAWRQVTDLSARAYRMLSEYDHAAILFMAEDRRPLVEIAGAVGRSLGTVKSAVRRLRRDGVLPRRAVVGG